MEKDNLNFSDFEEEEIKENLLSDSEDSELNAMLCQKQQNWKLQNAEEAEEDDLVIEKPSSNISFTDSDVNEELQIDLEV